MAGALANLSHSVAAVLMDGSAVAPASPDSGGQSAGAFPSRGQCVECCIQQRADYGPRPSVRFDAFVGWPGSAEVDLAVAKAPSESDDHVLDVASTAAQYLIQCCPSVRAQVKPVCHLDRVGRTLPTTFGVCSGPIADE